MKKKLHTADNFEINQCANLHLAAAVEWHCTGRSSRAPSIRRVGFLAKEFREIELLQAEEADLAVVGRDDGKAAALRSLTHDVVSPHHDRDYRALSCFLLTHVRAMCKSPIFVVELNEQARRAAAYCFDVGDIVKDDSLPLFLLAHRGRLKWLKPSAESTPALQRDWHLQFDKVYRIKSFDWRMFLAAERIPTDVPTKLYDCRHCQANVKYGIPECGFGGIDDKRATPIALSDRTGVAEEKYASSRLSTIPEENLSTQSSTTPANVNALCDDQPKNDSVHPTHVTNQLPKTCDDSGRPDANISTCAMEQPPKKDFALLPLRSSLIPQHATSGGVVVFPPPAMIHPSPDTQTAATTQVSVKASQGSVPNSSSKRAPPMRGQGENTNQKEADGTRTVTSSVGVQADESDLDLLRNMAITPDEANATLPKHVSMENWHNNLHMSGALSASTYSST